MFSRTRSRSRAVRLATTLVICFSTIAVAHTNAHGETLHFTVDTEKSEIKATVDEPLSTFTGSVEGTFQIMRGDISGDPANPATGHVEIVINPTTYDSGNSHRDNVILRDALETRNYSMIRFVGSRVEDLQIVAPGAIGKATVVGYLTLHGATREIHVPVDATLSPTDHELTVNGDVTFDYTEFGISVPHAGFMLPVGKNADISFRIIATPSGDAPQQSPPGP